MRKLNFSHSYKSRYIFVETEIGHLSNRGVD